MLVYPNLYNRLYDEYCVEGIVIQNSGLRSCSIIDIIEYQKNGVGNTWLYRSRDGSHFEFEFI